MTNNQLEQEDDELQNSSHVGCLVHSFHHFIHKGCSMPKARHPSPTLGNTHSIDIIQM